MTRVLALPLFVILTLVGALKAQTSSTPSVAEPQYINTFYALDASGKLTQLEHQTVTTFHSKTKVLPGYATVKVLAEFRPARASVRLPAGIQFIVRGRSPLDPSSLYELRLLKVSKDHRDILMTQAHGTIVGGTSNSKLDEGALAPNSRNMASIRIALHQGSHLRQENTRLHCAELSPSFTALV